MTEEKWSEIQDMIKEKFVILEEITEPIELLVGPEKLQKIGDKEIIIFTGPMGKTKIEYIVKPVVLDKKEHYSKRMGTNAATEFILSDTEFVRRIEGYLWQPASSVDGNDIWEKIDTSIFEND